MIWGYVNMMLINNLHLLFIKLYYTEEI